MRRADRGVAVAACGLVLFVAGCATRIANVDHRMLLPQGGDRIELESQQLFVMPIALAQPEPAFPPKQAGSAEPVEVTVCAEIWLSTDGDVTRVAPFDDAPDCAAGDDAGARAYAQAAAEALRHWEFTPAMICDFPPQALDKLARGDCTGPEVSATDAGAARLRLYLQQPRRQAPRWRRAQLAAGRGRAGAGHALMLAGGDAWPPHPTCAVNPARAPPASAVAPRRRNG